MNENIKSISIVKTLKQIGDYIKENVKEEFAEMNLTGSQGMVVGTLAHNGEMKISDISKKMGLSNSTVSGIIDRLEKQGFVERVRSEEDRRIVLVRITPEFKKKSKKHFTAINKKIDIIMNEASREDIDKIIDGLNILKELIDKNAKKENR